PHLKLAPISPPLGQAAKLGEFPVSFSKSWSDLDLATPYGPYLVIEGVDQFDATFSVLQYVNETEAWDPPQTNTSPAVARAWSRLGEVSAAKFPAPERYRYDHGGLENFCWAIQGDGWYAKGLPYFDPPTRSNALACLRRYFHEDVLVTNRFQWREFPK